MESALNSEPLPPLLRWVGGKQRLVTALSDLVVKDLTDRVYHEPFLGAGSLFFRLRPEKAHLSDANAHLMSCYRFIRDNPRAVSRELRTHRTEDCEQHYYKVRDRYNRTANSAAQAARFIYLNRTSFNGIFRVNKRGQYNVPYGHLAGPRIPTNGEIHRAALALSGVTLTTQSFEQALERVRESDFVYLDPPYPPLNGTAFFTHYTPERFDQTAQEALASAIESLHKRGALFLMSNADSPLIRALYSDFMIQSIKTTRSVSGKHKHRVADIVVTNFNVDQHA